LVDVEAGKLLMNAVKPLPDITCHQLTTHMVRQPRFYLSLHSNFADEPGSADPPSIFSTSTGREPLGISGMDILQARQTGYH